MPPPLPRRNRTIANVPRISPQPAPPPQPRWRSLVSIVLVGLSVVLLSFAVLLAAGPKVAVVPSGPHYARDIRPQVDKYCFKCHNEQKHKGDVNLAGYADERAILRGREVWYKAWQMISTGEMPPKKEPQPTIAEREALAAWIEHAVNEVDPSGPRDPGRVVLRRLTRTEYRNTIHDLLGIDFRPADQFPADEVGYGFDNIGDVLSLPPLLMEKYLDAAETIVGQAIVTQTTVPVQTVTLTAASMHCTVKGGERGSARAIISNGEAYADQPFAVAGKYKVRIGAWGEQAGSEPARMTLRLDKKPVQTFDVVAVLDKPGVYEATVEATAGDHRVAAAFVNDYYVPKTKDTKQEDRNLVVDWVEITGPLDAAPVTLPETHTRIFDLGANPPADPREAARLIVQRFAKRAFRRPITPPELERFAKLFDLARQQGEGFESSIALVLQSVLVSPHFLFRVEGWDDTAKSAVRPVSDYELATRLSYFLWSTTPDAPLMEAAAAGKLHEAATLEQQVRRMLKDPRSRALAENFAVQWLQLRRLKAVSPDTKLFPEWNEPLRYAMSREPVELFDAIVQDDGNVLDLLDCNYTFVNETLAKLYGIDGVTGEQMRRVPLADPRRGGVMTSAAVLTATSNPGRTSPVKRGKWVLETMLGTPPPPPSPDVGELEATAPPSPTTTLRQRLEMHRASPVCASCHKRMDPIGFGFEHFNPIGQWRETDGNLPIDDAATLVDGRSFKGPVELKKALMAHKDDFTRCLTEKMMTYALGRGLEYYDAGPVRDITRSAAEHQYKFSAIVLGIARSFPFQNRRSASAQDQDIAGGTSSEPAANAGKR
jgi:hypothetical protein